MPDLSRRGVLAAAIACAATPSFAAGALVPADALQTDVRLLERAYTLLHPGLHRYNTPARMAARFEALRRALSRPSRLSDAYLALSRLTAAVRCGHSYPNPFNQSDAVVADLYGGRDRLPFHFAWVGQRMVVLKDLTGEGSLERGTEVLAIDGVAPRTMLRAMLPLSRADGSNDGKRVRNLEVRGEGRWEAFDIHLPMLFPAIREAATLALRTPDGRRRETRVALMTAREREALGASSGETGAGPAWRMERRAGGVAILTMPTWALYDSPWDWKAWLGEALDRLAEERAPALIVDLRGNEGGLDCGALVLERLVARDLRPVADRRFVRYRKVPDDLAPHLSTWDRSFRDWGEAAVGPDARGFYRLTRYDDDPEGDVIRPKGRRFTGKLVVLTDASNSSATFQFTQAIRDNGLGTLVGQTTGGNRRGINGGAFFFLRLPGSGLEVDVPLIGRFPVTPQPDGGVPPDIAVARTVASIAGGSDPEMAAALRFALA